MECTGVCVEVGNRFKFYKICFFTGYYIFCIFYFTTSSDAIEYNACLVDQIKSNIQNKLNIAKAGLPFDQHELNPGE